MTAFCSGLLLFCKIVKISIAPLAQYGACVLCYYFSSSTLKQLEQIFQNWFYFVLLHWRKWSGDFGSIGADF